MSKMSVADAAAYFGVSREAIHNRVRRGSLSSVVEDGIKLVVVDKKSVTTRRPQTKKTVSSSNDKYYKLLEEHNLKLQERVDKLEGETRTLRDQKEQMLIDERIKIEQIYRDKDEQLKNILSSFKSQFLLNSPELEVEHVDADIEVEEVEEKSSNTISLKKYLKKQKLSSKKEQKIKSRFKKAAKKDDRIITIGSKYYLDLDKFDYRDLF